MSKRRRIREEWMRLRDAYEDHCAYCGLKPLLLVREHMVPVIRGGDDAIENIIPSCGPCNIRKGSMTPLEWFLTRLGFWTELGKTYRDTGQLDLLGGAA